MMKCVSSAITRFSMMMESQEKFLMCQTSTSPTDISAFESFDYISIISFLSVL